MKSRLAAGSILIAEVVCGGYLSFLTWAMCVWFIDDSRAVRMEPAEWYLEGARRFGLALVGATAFGAVAYYMNRRWVSPVLPERSKVGSRVALTIAVTIALSGMAGAVQFVTTRPFM